MATPSTPSSAVFDVQEHIIPASHIREYLHATADSQEAALVLHVKQYTPKDASSSPPRKGDVTIIGAHGNGFPKELYEPLLEDLYLELRRLGIRIRSIYFADCAWQGRSGILNEAKLGNDPNWLDYGRDVAHLINVLRPPRPLLGVGHSFGSIALLHAALNHPRLFTSLVLMDPVLYPHQEATGSPLNASIRRRDAWPSRAAARAAMQRNPFYASWDPRAFDRYVQFGLTEIEPGPDPKSKSKSDSNSNPNSNARAVRLTTSKHQEVFTFARPVWPAYDPSRTQLLRPSHIPDLNPRPSPNAPPPFLLYRAETGQVFARLPTLRPGVLYILGGQSNLPRTEAMRTRKDVTGVGAGGSGGIAAGRVEEVVDADSGHLVSFENPRFCARHTARWWRRELAVWEEEEAAWEDWRARPAGEKAVLGEDWLKVLGEAPRAGSRREKDWSKL